MMETPRRDSATSQDQSWSLNEPLMHDSGKDPELGTPSLARRRTRLVSPYLFHAIIFVFYSLAFFAPSLWQNHRLSNTFAYSPATDAVKYRKVSYHGELEHINPYRGDPRPELDKAWRDLLENNNIRISKEELVKMNKTALELYDGSGYYGQMSVYHHLHCLKFIRRVLHSDYYPEVNTVDRDVHVDHCVDDIRQALMCHADTSVLTFNWKSPDWRRPWPDFAVDHTCVDWDALDAWASDRSFSVFDQKSLVHPELGLAFPMIDGKIEDISHGQGMHLVWPEDHSSITKA